MLYCNRALKTTKSWLCTYNDVYVNGLFHLVDQAKPIVVKTQAELRVELLKFPEHEEEGKRLKNRYYDIL